MGNPGSKPAVHHPPIALQPTLCTDLFDPEASGASVRSVKLIADFYGFEPPHPIGPLEGNT